MSPLIEYAASTTTTMLPRHSREEASSFLSMSANELCWNEIHFLARESLSGDSAVSTNNVIRRSAFHVEQLYDLPILPVPDLRPCDALVFDHRLKRFRVIIKGYSNQNKAFALMFSIEVFQQGNLPYACPSPGGPEIQQHHPSFEVGNRDGLAGR